MTNANFQLDHAILTSLRNDELETFRKRTPESRALLDRGRKVMPNGVPCSWMSAFYPGTDIFAARGEGCWIEDADGNRYLDMTQCDLSMVCGYGPSSIARAVSDRFANGSHFLMPTEDAIIVSELLADRFSMPAWQFTLSASAANTEAIRISRFATGRDKVIIFKGKYHGHIDETLIAQTDAGHAPDHHGLRRGVEDGTVEIDFNDIDALETELAKGDVACVLAEPVMTNISVIQPDPGYHAALRESTRRHGVLLIVDETHTQVAVYGGFTRLWSLQPDILTLGKCVGGGVPIGCYGLSEELRQLVEANTEPAAGDGKCLALGGTTYGNALNMAAARAALEHVLTEEGYARVTSLGRCLADGIQTIIDRVGLPWRAHHLGNRSGICLGPDLPRNAKEAYATVDKIWNLATRAFMANRGIWEPIYIHGPSVSFAHTEEDVDRYLQTLDDWMATVVDRHD